MAEFSASTKRIFISTSECGQLPALGLPSETLAVGNSLNSSQLLSTFDAHGLDDNRSDRLMNRVDHKFVVNTSVLLALLNDLASHYSILEIQKRRVFCYENTYFDTPDHTLYLMHHNGKLNRYKIRIRHYVETNSYFLEVKFKTNKKRTVKYRCPINDNSCLQSHKAFLDELGLHSHHHFVPALQNRYSRIALASECGRERITLDMDLQFQCPNTPAHASLPNVAIVEHKQDRSCRESAFARLLQRYRLQPVSVSKYCVGLSQCRSDLKSNRFKAIHRHISRQQTVLTPALLQEVLA